MVLQVLLLFTIPSSPFPKTYSMVAKQAKNNTKQRKKQNEKHDECYVWVSR